MSDQNFDSIHTEDGSGSLTSRISAITRTQPEPVGRIHGPDSEDMAAVAALPPDSALLIAVSGPNQGARFLLNADRVTVGRNPQSDIFLDDFTVSRRHAVFIREDGQFFVRDLCSLNGTYVNRELTEEAKLFNGDIVQIGKYRLTFCKTS